MAEDDDLKDAAPAREEFKVFVGGISYRMDEAGLMDLFSKYNPISATIQVDKMTQKPRGFGFVSLRDRESLLDAVRDLHNKDVDGRPISVKDAIPQDQIKPGTPASAIGRGGYDRRDGDRRYERPERRGGGSDRGYDRGGYDRYAGGGGGYDRGSYDRYAGGAAYAADPRGGYDYRGGGGSYYGGAYERGADPYARDPYYRADPYAQPAYAAGGAAYDQRYDSRYSAYPAAEYPPTADDRYRGGAGGPDRGASAGRYPPPRAAGPYDRPDARRDVRR